MWEQTKEKRKDFSSLVLYRFSNILYKLTIGNDKKMPSFMLLSINEDKLNISFAGGFGGFKKYYASFKLSNLVFEQKFTVDKMVDHYQFSVLDDERMKLGDFFLIAIKHRKDAEKLVDAIINYNE